MQKWDFEHPLSTGNVLPCYKERYLLLMKCFITFLGCVKMAERASDSIDELLMVHSVRFLPTTNLKFHAKFQFSGRYPPSKGDVMLCYKERHPLLLDYFIPFLECIKMDGRASDSPYESLMGYTTCHFCQ